MCVRTNQRPAGRTEPTALAGMPSATAPSAIDRIAVKVGSYAGRVENPKSPGVVEPRESRRPLEERPEGHLLNASHSHLAEGRLTVPRVDL